MATIQEIHEATSLFLNNLRDPIFKKSAKYDKDGERGLLKLLKFFYLGKFGNDLEPEAKVNSTDPKYKTKRVDFLIGDTAVEIAVRKPDGNKISLSSYTNSSEIRKLMKHQGTSVLILIDFSKSPYARSDIETYRDWPSLGKGNHKLSAFNVLYYFFEKKELLFFQRNIRVG